MASLLKDKYENTFTEISQNIIDYKIDVLIFDIELNVCINFRNNKKYKTIFIKLNL